MRHLQARTMSAVQAGPAIGFALAMLATAGCAVGGATGQVSGQVRFQNKPLPLGRINFFSAENGNLVAFSTITDGTYTIASCPTGEVKIAIESFGRASEDIVPKGLAIKPPGQNDRPGLPAVKAVNIPARYRDPAQSELTLVVKRGAHTHDIELAP